MNRFVFIFCCLSCVLCLSVQAQSELTLREVLLLAKKQSIDYQLRINDFLSSYWDYRMSKIAFLPSASWSATPASLNRTLTERYDYDQNVDVYRETQTLNSSTSFSISQAIPFTGGNVSLSSSLSRLDNLASSVKSSYGASPVRISFSQPLFAHNSYKWDQKLIPLKLKIAKQKLLNEEQELYRSTANLFFELLQAQVLLSISEFEYQNADTLCRAGKRLKELNLITNNELVELELKKVKARITVVEHKQRMKDASYSLSSFLRLGFRTDLLVKSGIHIPNIELRADDVLSLALQNNPIYSEIEQERLNVDKSLDQAKKQNRFNANMSLSYGLNKSGESLKETFDHPMNQQSASVSFSVPLLNWGKRRANLALQLRKNEVKLMQIEQRVADFEKDLHKMCVEFHLQYDLINSTKLATKLAKLTYETKIKQFAIGQIELTDLNSSWLSYLDAQKSELDNIQKYWQLYFELQKSVLVDLQTNEPLKVDFDNLITILNI